jgi:hypothetical protein
MAMRNGLLLGLMLLPIAILAQTPPEPPVPLVPAEGAVNVAMTSNFKWTPSPTPEANYVLQVSTHPAFNSADIVADMLTGGDNDWVSSLPQGMTYYWRMSAFTVDGDSPWTAPISFSTLPLPPPAPVNVSPTIWTTDVSLTPTLTWQASAGATGYFLSVSTDADFLPAKTVYSNSATTSMAIGPLQPRTRYYWSVKAVNMGGAGDGSSSWHFLTQGPPIAPAALWPDAGYKYMPQDNVPLSWNNAGDGGGEVGDEIYRVQLSLNPEFSSLVLDTAGLTEPEVALDIHLDQETYYYWRVSASNGQGAGPWAASNFRTIPYPPVSGTPVKPADGAMNLSLQTEIKWRKIPDIATYRLQIAEDAGFNTIVFNDSALYDTAFTTYGLANGRTYYWHVRARNLGGAGTWSDTRTFSTIPLAPGAVPLNAPANASLKVFPDSVFHWDAVAGAASYRLQVATNEAFISPWVDMAGLTSASLAFPALAPDKLFYWRVNATNAGGTGAWSDAWTFSSVQPIPDIPALVTPLQNEVDVAIASASLYWSSTQGAMSFHVQVSADAGFPDGPAMAVNDSGLNVMGVFPGTLLNGTVYHWRVRAKSTGGVSAWSEVRRFITIPLAPAKPENESPLQAEAHAPLSPVLVWKPAARAESYDIQASQQSDFATLAFITGGVVTTSVQLPNKPVNTTLYWRVRARNSAGAGEWSDTWSFTTYLAAPAAPTLALPENSAIGADENTQFTWNASTTAAAYRIQVSTQADFSILSANSQVSGLLKSGLSLTPGTLYYWRVWAENVGGISEWSETRSFTTNFLAPTAPFPVTPTSGATDVSFNPTLVWSSPSGITTFEIQIYGDAGLTELVESADVPGTGSSYSPYLPPVSKTYYWIIRSSNAHGTSPWSAAYSFTTRIPAPTPPPAPNLLSPDQAATGAPIRPTFTWSPVSGATGYILFVSPDSGFHYFGTTDTVSGASHTVDTLLADKKYFWWVKTIGAAGVSGLSAQGKFTTEMPFPSVPIQIHPADKAVNVKLNTQLTWSYNRFTVSYHYQVATDTGFAEIVREDSLMNNGVFSNVFLPGKTYYYRVRARNTAGTSPWSQVFSFTTIPPRPAYPYPLYPASFAVNIPLNPVVKWNTTTNTDSYRMTLTGVSRTDTTLQAPLFTQTLTDTAGQVGPLLPDYVYTLILTAYNSGDSSTKMMTRFATVPPLPEPMQLLLPLPGDTLKSDSLLAVWKTGTSKTDRYWVEVSRDSTFAVSIIDSAITDTSKIIAYANASGIFWWRAKAHNAAGWGGFSAIRPFEVKAITTAILSRTSAFRFSPGGDMFHYSLPASVSVSIRIHDPSGKLVSTPVHARQSQGPHTLALGPELRTPGLYFLSFRAGGYYRQERFIWGY